MLQLSRETMNAFEGASFARFQAGLAQHLQSFFPLQAQYLGPEGLLCFVEHACDAAESFGFKNKRSLYLWTDLSMMFGIGFHDDPQLPWAARILNDCHEGQERDRINRLWEHAVIYQRYVLGDEVLPERPYRSDRHFRALGERGMHSFSYDNDSYLRLIWPEKSYLVIGSGFAQLQDISLGLAKKYGIGDEGCREAITVHAFIFGHAFASDPQFPWVLPALESYCEASAGAWLRQFTQSFDERMLGGL